MSERYVWQQAFWDTLTRPAQRAHAWLLHGPAGIGKRDLVRQLAAFWLCREPHADGACGQCKACKLLAAGSHPDYLHLLPDEPGKPIRIDQIRELVGFVAQTAQLEQGKFVIIEPVEAMNPNAANALLKSLEEPGEGTRFLLVSDQPSRVLPTIRSRCLMLACPQPSPVEALAWLQAQLPEQPEASCTALLELAAGSPLAALELQRAKGLEMRAAVVEDVKALLKRQLTPCEVAERWQGHPLPLLLDWFCRWSQAVVRYQLSGDPQTLGTSDMDKVLGYIGERSTPAAMLSLLDWLLEQRRQVLDRANLNRVLLLEALLVKWAALTGRD